MLNCLPPRFALIAAACMFLGTGPLRAATPTEPHLLIRSGDVPRLRHICGIERNEAAPESWGAFRSGVADYQALRDHFRSGVDMGVLPGELLAAAFLHVVDPSDPGDAARLALINEALRNRSPLADDPLECILALDWCWDALEPTARDAFLSDLTRDPAPLSDSDSPLRPREFRPRLAALALALALDADRLPGVWQSRRAALLDRAARYYDVTFPKYVTWRTATPTSASVASQEERDTALAIEIGSLAADRDFWGTPATDIAHWLDHYALADIGNPALRHGFVHGDAPAAPLLPRGNWDALQPLTAHLIAARTASPLAQQVARNVAAELRATDADPRATPWRWIPLLFPVPEASDDAAAMPLASDLGGSVVFRSGTGPDATLIWIDAAQPFLRAGQHFAAGHFTLYRAGHLLNSSAAAIEQEAVLAKGGAQYLGRDNNDFDFAQYNTASIAHNCLLLWDAARVPRWHGVLYAPRGGQQPHDETCTDFARPLESQDRNTGQHLALAQTDGAAYLALDLVAAYGTGVADTYTREFIFIEPDTLLVVDRVQPRHGRAKPVLVFNLPARPLVDGAALTPAERTEGPTNDAGVWSADSGQWLRWVRGDGGLWLAVATPEARRLSIVGGPATERRVANGPCAGRTYMGGEPNGFERLVTPTTEENSRNAWYRLGTPTLLGPLVSELPHWGRIEIAPRQRAAEQVFITVMVADRSGATNAPKLNVETSDAGYDLTLTSGLRKIQCTLPAQMQRGGVLRVDSPAKKLRWSLSEASRDHAADPVLPEE